MSTSTMHPKTVLITGASAGIGRATALAFARQGARLTLMARRPEAAPDLVDQLLRAGAQQVRWTSGDVARDADVRRAIGAAVAQGGRLDAAVNCAGVIEAPLELHEQTEAAYQRVFDTNVRGIFLCLRHELAQMRAQGGDGVIVNVSSVAGARGVPRLSLYAASKHAVEGMSRSAALENAAAGIRVLSVQPHATESPMMDGFVGAGETPARQAVRSSVPLRRMAAADEQASVIAFLCSPAARFMTGTAVPVDGGFLAR